MRVSQISNNVIFTAGKVNVYSDFDGTYCPASHASLHNIGENTYMNGYCANIDRFFKETENDLAFRITTGRTFGEFKGVMALLKERGFKLPLPVSFISKNGSDEYIRTGDALSFYETGEFPYQYNNPNPAKENRIKELTNWQGKEIKEFIREKAKQYNIRMIEADSENSVRDYGENSLFSEGKLNPSEWEKLPQKDGHFAVHTPPVVEAALGARKDGNLKINLIFSPDYGYSPERNRLYDNFMNEIRTYLQGRNVKYDMSWDIPNPYNYYRNHCNISPVTDNKPLSKVFDTKSALENALKNKDLVIVAGDGINDFEMLNPLEYIETEFWEECKSKSAGKEFYKKDMYSKILALKDVYSGKAPELKQTLENDGLLKKIEELPFLAIVMKNENKELNTLAETFSKAGKIIQTQNGELEKGIKKAVREYCKKNPEFKNSMSEKFRNTIFEVNKKKDYKIALTGGIAAFLLFCFGIHLKKSNQNTEK